VGDKLGIFKASVSRAVHEVVDTVNGKTLPQWVRWPRNVTSDGKVLRFGVNAFSLWMFRWDCN